MIVLNKIVKLNDGSEIEVCLTGNSNNKTIMLPIAKKSVFGQAAETLKLWGVDPELGNKFVAGLSDTFQVVFFDYEGHRLEHPNRDNLTPETIVKDFLLIADELKVEKFGYYGYSWLALAGLQLAIRMNRLECLIMGGFPPIEGPYKEMMTVTTKTYEQVLNNQDRSEADHSELTIPEEIDWDNIQVQMNPDQTKQFVTMYKSLLQFQDKKVQDRLHIPRLTFAGEEDTIIYGENFGNVSVDVVGLIKKNKRELEQLGWDVEIVEGVGMDHTKAMQPAAVLPLIKPWLIKNLLS